MKKFFTTLLCIGFLALGATSVSAQANSTAPKSVIHVVTVKWKPGTTPAQIKAALDAAHEIPKNFKGVTRVWTNAFKNQTSMDNIIVMEFADQAALAAYADSPAQKKWYEAYLPIREQSITSDITN
jgi:uncharacterized protein (DUF1330 family)